MGYRILYGGKEPKHSKPGKRRIFSVCICTFLIAGIFCKAHSIDVLSAVQQFLMPGFTEEASKLLEQAVVQIREGEPVAEALHSFCVEVIASETN